MAEVLGTKKLLRAFEKLERESRRKNNGNVIVGFNASYALFVHEMVEKHAGEKRTGKHPSGQKKRGRYWDPQGRAQPKFLEQPSRDPMVIREMVTALRTAAKNGAPLIKALLMAGLRLQRAAQLLVPVDTGNLKGSAFTEKE